MDFFSLMAGKSMASGSGHSEAFWDTYQDYGNRRNYDDAFAGDGWTAELFNPKYPIIAESYIRTFTNNKQITEIKVPLDFTGYVESEESDMCFLGCSALKTIQSLKVGRNTAFFGSFDHCYSLEHIGFEGELWYDLWLNESENLNDETLMQLTHIAKDFIHDEDEEVQSMCCLIYFSPELSDKVWELEADERFPEEYQGMILGEVLLEKGWGC